ncbi:MAG: sigma-70 family RNA polymerase sigma factor [Gammaproteobacteria bacterium]|nr:sigma-70 family RNA polymerase sigma factor [Gammaproteobacteria bacterium]
MSPHADFTALVAAYADDLYRYARFLCRDPHRAEDLVQETLLRSWSGFGSLRKLGSAKAWLLTTLRREHFRDGKAAQELSLDDPEHGLTDAELTQEAHDLDGVLDAERRLDALPAAYREVLILQLHFGYSTLEIATLLGITDAAVANRLLRARRALASAAESETPACTVVPFQRRAR